MLLYGSRARGDHGPRSDIDLAIECRETSHGDSDRAWFEIEAYLEDEAPTLLKIDATRLDRAPATLRREIEREGIALYEGHAP